MSDRENLSVADLCEEEVLSSLDNCALTLTEMANVLRGFRLGGCADICDAAAKRARDALDPGKEARAREEMDAQNPKEGSA